MDSSRILSSVLLLYLAIGTNFLKELFSCELQSLLSRSVLIKNVLGVLVFHFAIVAPTIMPGAHPVSQLAVSLAAYTIFFLTTRCDYRVVIAMFIVAVAVMFAMSIDEYNKKQRSSTDDGQSRSHRYVRSVIAPVMCLVLLTGVIAYVGYKAKSLSHLGIHKDAFDWKRFITGVPQCPEILTIKEMNLDSPLVSDFSRGVDMIKDASYKLSAT